jgi:hypothetical protein
MGIEVDDTTKTQELLPRLNETLKSGISNDNWERFQETVTEMNERVKTIARIPTNYNNNTRKNNNKPRGSEMAAESL